MTLFKKLFALTFLFASLISTAAQADYPAIQSRGVLNVAVPQDFPPFGSVGTDMQLQGYDIDTARYLAKEMGLKIKLVPVTSANRIPYLETGKVDLVISSLGKNPEREKAIDFSRAYAPFFLGVFGPKSIKVAGPADLSGKTIAVTRGAVEDLELSKVAPKDAVIKRFEDNNTTISAFLSGQTDLIATGNLVMAKLLKQDVPRKPLPKFTLKNSPCYVGMAKGEPQLMAKVNDLIEKGIKNGEFDKLSSEWFGTPFPASLKN